MVKLQQETNKRTEIFNERTNPSTNDIRHNQLLYLHLAIQFGQNALLCLSVSSAPHYSLSMSMLFNTAAELKPQYSRHI